MLNLIGGIDQPTSGEVRVGDQSIGQLHGRTLAKWRARNIGFIFQLYNLIPVLTAIQNVELPLLLVKMSGKASGTPHPAVLSLETPPTGATIRHTVSGRSSTRTHTAPLEIRAGFSSPHGCAVEYACRPTWHPRGEAPGESNGAVRSYRPNFLSRAAGENRDSRAAIAPRSHSTGSGSGTVNVEERPCDLDLLTGL